MYIYIHKLNTLLLSIYRSLSPAPSVPGMGLDSTVYLLTTGLHLLGLCLIRWVSQRSAGFHANGLCPIIIYRALILGPVAPRTAKIILISLVLSKEWGMDPYSSPCIIPNK